MFTLSSLCYHVLTFNSFCYHWIHALALSLAFLHRLIVPNYYFLHSSSLCYHYRSISLLIQPFVFCLFSPYLSFILALVIITFIYNSRPSSRVSEMEPEPLGIGVFNWSRSHPELGYLTEAGATRSWVFNWSWSRHFGLTLVPAPTVNKMFVKTLNIFVGIIQISYSHY